MSVSPKRAVFLREHSPRAVRLKAGISSAFLLTIMLDPHFAMVVALMANLLWLWVDFE